MSKENSFSPTRHHFPEGVVNYIEELSYELPWFFFKDCAYGNSAIEKGLDLHPYFSHTFLEDNQIGPCFHKMPWRDMQQFQGAYGTECLTIAARPLAPISAETNFSRALVSLRLCT